ncbi:hypothetical protein [uncultured Megamonas sp.]|uniref:hypothetical protein n=1 Tax=uncultured Megamonas sp. TaxID=286140 RepID=UPI00259B77D7|nr:hypothetical protein [uncultured Megamonas sp.]
MTNIRDFILSRGNFGTLRTPQQYINAFNIKKNIDAMFGQGTSDKIADTINRVDDAKDKAKQTFTQGVNQAKSKAKSVLDKALKNPVVQKVAPVVNTVVGATGAANAADRASRYALTTTPKEKIIDNTQRILYGVGGVTGALGMTPVATAANAAAMGLNNIEKDYIPRGSGVNNPADYANLYTPEQLAGRGLDPVSVARYLELQDAAKVGSTPVRTQPTQQQSTTNTQQTTNTQASKPPTKSALEEVNEFLIKTNNNPTSLPPLPSATGPAYLGQDSVGNFIRRNTDPRTTYVPQNVETPVWKTEGSAPVPTAGLNFTQAAGDSGYDSNGNSYLSALQQPQVPQYIPEDYGNNTGNSGIPNLGFAANPYAQRLADEYERLTNLDYQQLRQQDQLARVQAQARGALLGLNEPLAYTSDLEGLNDRVNALREAAKYQDAMAMSDKYGMPLSAGFASPDTLVNNIYGPMFKAPLKAQEDYRNAMYKMDVNRANAINNILRDTNKSELDKARDLEKANRAYAQEAELQRQKLEAARALEEYKQNQQNARANLSAQTQAKLLDKRLSTQDSTGTTAKPPTLSSLANAYANLVMIPGQEQMADIIKQQILKYYGPQALTQTDNIVKGGTVRQNNSNNIDYFGD